MDDIELAQDRHGVVGQDHLLQVVDDDLVASVRAQRGLDCAGDCPARVDVAYDGAIFCVVAGLSRQSRILEDSGTSIERRGDGREDGDLLLVALLEQATVGSVGY